MSFLYNNNLKSRTFKRIVTFALIFSFLFCPISAINVTYADGTSTNPSPGIVIPNIPNPVIPTIPTVNPSTAVKTYVVTYSLSGCSATGADAAVSNANYVGYLTAYDSYELPDYITVRIGDNIYTDDSSYITYSSTTGIFTIDKSIINGNITIYATASKDSAVITEVVVNGSFVEYSDARVNAEFSGRIVANEGYSLPDAITVVINGVTYTVTNVSSSGSHVTDSSGNVVTSAICGITYVKDNGYVYIPVGVLKNGTCIYATCVSEKLVNKNGNADGTPITIEYDSAVIQLYSISQECTGRRYSAVILPAKENEELTSLIIGIYQADGSVKESYVDTFSSNVIVNGEQVIDSGILFNAYTDTLTIRGENVTGNIYIFATTQSVDRYTNNLNFGFKSPKTGFNY